MESQTQLDKMVINHFISQKEIYINSKPSEAINTVVKYIKNKNMNQSRVLDIGTGGGHFIFEIKAEIPITNCSAVDITMDTLKIIKKDVEGINFVGSSVYALPFSDNSFDIIIFGDLLHHLIGKNRKKSIELVNKALGEILRVAKAGSIVCILEECISFKYQSILLFWLTFCFAKLNLSSKFFYINNKLIISFLTYNELKKLLFEHGIKIDYMSIWESKSWKIKMLKVIARLRFYTLIGIIQIK